MFRCFAGKAKARTGLALMILQGGVYHRTRVHWGMEAMGNKKPNLVGWAKCLNLLVPLGGIELPTFALRMRCSTD